MADGATSGVADLVLKLVGGTAGLTAVGVLLRGFLSGTIATEKEVRDDLRVEVNRLREDQIKLKAEVDTLRVFVSQLTTTNLHLINSRAEARALANTLERELSRAVTVWPADSTGGP